MELIELIPRFATEDCVADYDANGRLQPVCLLEQVEPGEQYDRIVTVKSLAWLGLGFFATYTVPGRPFQGEA